MNKFEKYIVLRDDDGGCDHCDGSCDGGDDSGSSSDDYSEESSP